METSAPAPVGGVVGHDRAPGASWLLVVCSLEPWGTVQRRLQLLVHAVVDLDPSVRVLYVEPAVDVPHNLAHGRVAAALRSPGASSGRVIVARPRKWLPRVLGSFTDRSLRRQLRRAVRRAAPGTAGPPTLWVNDTAYAVAAAELGWPCVYDVTDDWLLASMTPRARARLAAHDDLLVRRSGAVVVCSPDLARTRGITRPVELIGNAVDVERFTTPRARPADLPDGPVLVYVGSLHEDRLDVDLCVDLAGAGAGSVALVGPDSLSAAARRRLIDTGNVRLLGAVPYDDVPAYLQHADVVIVPHRVTPFTESLDPIKAYECVAVGRPTVATPVAGFRGLGAPIVVADRAEFVAAVRDALDRPVPGASAPAPAPTWADRGRQFLQVIRQVQAGEQGA